ncbi:hypothetical protein IAD21_00800 [Abditibacteriota bacterium]|nr:hypothetical protein IAD21_00800 [Abditibacteriota bacterium]
MSQITLSARPTESFTDSLSKLLLVDETSGRKPKTVARLSDWAYLEHAIFRMLCGWCRHTTDWDDKQAWFKHIWESAESVHKLRQRAIEFPGTSGNLDAPVSAKLERLANTVLLAPSYEDAVDGIYDVLLPALNRSYQDYGARANPIHDAPTLSTLHDVLGYKNGMRLWIRDYRRRVPHTTDATYKAAIEAQIQNCGELLRALPVESDDKAAPCGVNTDFRLLVQAARPANAKPFSHNLYALVRADVAHSIESRRLFWCLGYMLENGLPEDQAIWIWTGHFMPFEWQRDIARHLWDEARHGDSGLSRLKDFGISLDEIGWSARVSGEVDEERNARRTPEELAAGKRFMRPQTRRELYEYVRMIGMHAETGHFAVKTEAYNDFRDGGDLESAEMMLFDIIDENQHVQYAHNWLPLLAQFADMEGDDFKAWGEKSRREAKEKMRHWLETDARNLDRSSDNPDFALYQQFLARMRQIKPLSNADSCPPRSHLPM